jgi:DNA-binding NarL/FixJ family response regulator
MSSVGLNFEDVREPQIRCRRPVPCQLSPDELELLQAIADGETYPSVAMTKGRHLETIKKRAQKLCSKLGADKMTHAIAIGFRKGLIS